MLNLQKRARILTLLFVVVSLFVQLPALHADQPNYLALTVLYTNDIHGHLFPFDYNCLGKAETNVGGAARRATLIREIKCKTTNPVIVMDAGDVFTRGPLQDLEGKPDFDVMNAVPYDIMTLGNNEFKGDSYLNNPSPLGLEILRDRIKQARFNIISANVIEKSTGTTLVTPYHIFEVEGIRIGVFGLTAPRVASYAQAVDLQLNDPIVTAKKMVAELSDKCDFIIALTHIGYNSDLALASSVPGIDVIIGGDSHTWLDKPTLVRNDDTGPAACWIGGTIVCQDGEWGKALGKLDLYLHKANNGRYLVMSYKDQIIDIDSSILPAQDVETIIDNYTKPYMVELDTLDKDITLSNAPAWIAERLRDATKSDIGFRPYDGVESGLNAGPVTELDLRKMVPWNNKVVVVKAKGAQISKLMLQPNAAVVGTEMRDGQLYVGDKKLDAASIYTVASEDYYAFVSPALSGAQITKTDLSTRDILRGYLMSKSATIGVQQQSVASLPR
ncbi:bifunctional metallophosphatase/5'-nucleotidase [bacterium]|nr:bifunctional metallophosphatase/5'-nucleotidase [bacterium]